jgi:hypothetical protein
MVTLHITISPDGQAIYWRDTHAPIYHDSFKYEDGYYTQCGEACGLRPLLLTLIRRVYEQDVSEAALRHREAE